MIGSPNAGRLGVDFDPRAANSANQGNNRDDVTAHVEAVVRIRELMSKRAVARL